MVAPAKLSKILARLDSPHPGEAAAALHLMQQQLARQSLTLKEVLAKGLDQAGSSTLNLDAVPARATLPTDELLNRLDQLEANYRQLVQLTESQTEEINQWRSRARQWEELQQQYRQQVSYWKNLANDVTEKLWAIGRQLSGQNFVAPPEPTAAPLPAGPSQAGDTPRWPSWEKPAKVEPSSTH